MAIFNTSNPTVVERLLSRESKKISQVLGKTRVKNKGYLAIISLGLLTGFNTAIGQEQALPSSQFSDIKSDSLTINRQGNRLNIEAKQVTWQTLFAKLKEKADINVQGKIPLQSMVTVTIPAQPVTEALQQLFSHRFDFVFLFPQQNKKRSTVPKTVWLLGNAKENVAQAASLDAKNTNIKPTSPPSMYKTDPSIAPVTESKKHGTIQELVDQARNDANPDLRLQALTSLSKQGNKDKDSTKLALETALEDNNASIRGYAVQAFASQEGQAATEHLRIALDDPDADVRLKAVESVALEGQGIALLQDALANPDELVQAIAEERLKQVNH